MNGSESWIGIAWGWSEYALTLAICAGAWAGLLAAVVLVINAFFRCWLSARQMSLLWGVVLFRLLIPVAPSSPLSLQNLAAFAGIETTAPILVDREPATVPGSAVHPQPVPAPSVTAVSPAPPAPEAAPNAFDLSGVVDGFFAMLPLIWVIGASACLIRTTIVHWCFCRRLKHAVACESPRLRNLWEACCQQAGVRRNVPILLFEGVQQPAVLGLIRPRLLLPVDAAELNDEQLRMIMLHELAHLRYWDIAANWVLVVVRALHWWNPVYWLAAARFQSLREQACDAFAIRKIEGLPIRNYSELLLTLVERQPSGSRWRVMLSVSILGFHSSFFRKRAIHSRLTALRSAGITRSRWHTAAVCGLVALAVVCGLTDASTPAASSDRSSDWLPRAGRTGNNWEWSPKADPGPNVVRTYDIEKVLQRIAADGLTKDEARLEMNDLLLLLIGSCTGRRYVVADEEAKEVLTMDDATVTLNAPLYVHAEVVRNLKAWEQSGLGQIAIGTRFITDERDIASAIGVSWRYLEAFSADREEDLPSETKIGMPVVRAKASVDDYLPIAVATLNEKQALALVQEAQKGKRVNVLQSPKVTLFNGQLASVLDLTQSPFVVGIQDGSAGVQQPKIAVIDEGIKLTLRAIQSSDGTKVQLEGRLELSEIGEVRTASTLLRGEPTTIQIPRVKRCRIDLSSEVPDGQTLLIACIPTYEQKRFFYMLLTVRNLSPSGEAN
jgi:bla regulator protein BlaR1